MYLNVNEFLNDLKELRRFEQTLQDQTKVLRDLEYLRYGKMKSPLDYDIVGYTGKTPIRQIKSRGYISDEERTSREASLDTKIQHTKSRIRYCQMKIQSVKDLLNKLDDDLKDTLIKIYVEKHSFQKIADGLNISKSALHKRIIKGIQPFIED